MNYKGKYRDCKQSERENKYPNSQNIAHVYNVTYTWEMHQNVTDIFEYLEEMSGHHDNEYACVTTRLLKMNSTITE